ncbi:hypothetical protein BDM02DRAFT_3139558 [Thelephora ganbajun]|uniref:Uncharacterized protein n=1 Tax=Thelephora ganbajun TaxID=370292 RepID=A0ACB6ZN92_THEGA|nr:hypothetical protein BDM02DRAFT_3139558 [Thelephora ganbajun]
MSRFDPRSHKTQLVFTALAASALTAAAITSYNSYSRQKKRDELNRQVLTSVAAYSSERDGSGDGYGNGEWDGTASSATYDEDLIREQLARNYAFFGEEGMKKIRGASVAVIGCGGVGSWAAVMLARSGVAKIRLVDFDYVTLSSLNRHAAAGLADVGTPKVRCLENALRKFSRWIEIDPRIELWKKEDGGALLEGVDWVIDAIDNISTKVDLLHYCHSNNIKVFSSMGAGAKSDPSRVQISDISYTVYDPLARSVRRRLRLLGVHFGIPVVYSTEAPGDVKLLPLPEEEFQKGDVKELGVLEDFRVRILPVLGSLPSIFGLHAATYVLCELAGKPISNPLPVKNRRKLYEKMNRDLQLREQRITGETINRLPIDDNDIFMIFEDVYRGRSILPPHDVPNKPALVRWDYTRPLSADNIVPMDQPDADKHIRRCHDLKERPEDVWGQEVRAVYERRMQEILKDKQWFMEMS